MTLLEEVQAARKKVVTDGYEMSLGELINLYRDEEIKIDPVFQRLVRRATQTGVQPRRWRDARNCDEEVSS